MSLLLRLMPLLLLLLAQPRHPCCDHAEQPEEEDNTASGGFHPLPLPRKTSSQSQPPIFHWFGLALFSNSFSIHALAFSVGVVSFLYGPFRFHVSSYATSCNNM